MTTKSPPEMAELEAQGAAALKAYYEAEARAVFGHDFKTDRHGRPIEQGHGARGHETANHFAALRKREEQGLEDPGSWQAAVEELWNRDKERAIKIGLPRPKAAA